MSVKVRGDSISYVRDVYGWFSREKYGFDTVNFLTYNVEEYDVYARV